MCSGDVVKMNWWDNIETQAADSKESILLFLYKQEHRRLQMVLHTREGYSICEQTGSHIVNNKQEVTASGSNRRSVKTKIKNWGIFFLLQPSERTDTAFSKNASYEVIF